MLKVWSCRLVSTPSKRRNTQAANGGPHGYIVARRLCGRHWPGCTVGAGGLVRSYLTIHYRCRDAGRPIGTPASQILMSTFVRSGRHPASGPSELIANAACNWQTYIARTPKAETQTASPPSPLQQGRSCVGPAIRRSWDGTYNGEVSFNCREPSIISHGDDAYRIVVEHNKLTRVTCRCSQEMQQQAWPHGVVVSLIQWACYSLAASCRCSTAEDRMCGLHCDGQDQLSSPRSASR